MLPVSFFIVQSVVEHGKCSRQNNIVLNAVSAVHPLSIRIFESEDKLSNSTM